MENNEDSGSPGIKEALFMQTRKDSPGLSSPRPSVLFSSKEDTGGQLQKLKQQLSRVLKGFSPPPEVKSGTYNPEVLTSQKRLWANQLQDHKSITEPFKLFESMVVVGLHPSSDVQLLHKKLQLKKIERGKKKDNTLNCLEQSAMVLMEPQVLLVYPPEKGLPLKCKDLLSFCFPSGLEVHAVEKTPSMSELNEILLGQEHLKQSDLSFVFRLQVADNSTLYGSCVLVEEIVQKPPALLSTLSEEQTSISTLTRHIITAPRCYCILSRLPFFELHFGVIQSIFAEERLRRLTIGVELLSLSPSENFPEDNITDISDCIKNKDSSTSDASILSSVSPCGASNHDIQEEIQVAHEDACPSRMGSTTAASQTDLSPSFLASMNMPASDPMMLLLRYYRLEREDGNRSDIQAEAEVTPFPREDLNIQKQIHEWAKSNKHGALEIISSYYQLHCPDRGSTLHFHPLEHLHPLEYRRPGEMVLQIAGTTVDMRSNLSSLESPKAHNALLAEEEATALSIWTTACMCANLRLENILLMFAGALLEKQIVVVCSNLGVLSALVLSVIPLIQPYQWQSLLMPVLPNNMLDFLDAPVPYVVGIKNRVPEVQSKLSNVILIDINKNQVKSQSMPNLPRQKELLSSLGPYHEKLVGESYLASKRPVYECTDIQVEAAKGFLAVLRSYLDSLCSNLRSHTITNVQSNDDKVSLLLKESFIDSFPSREQPFMKLFVDTQLFSVHTDFVLSFYQKD
ncbi:DENN (AEX-3) domain-containing protein [Wolffia australiana]